MDCVKFITLTNNGYTDLTLNAIESLKRLNMDIECYCIGDKCYSIINSNNVKCHKINNKVTEFQRFRTGDWSKITIEKLNIVYDNLHNNKYVCIADGDIVFENSNFLKYCLDNIDNNDIIIQSDTLDDNDDSNYCSGFMFIKSNEKTLNFFNPNMTKQHIGVTVWDDQGYVNTQRDLIKIKTLPLELYPNGMYYYKYKPLKPYIIHFNWCAGDKKKSNMKKLKKWYLD